MVSICVSHSGELKLTLVHVPSDDESILGRNAEERLA